MVKCNPYIKERGDDLSPLLILYQFQRVDRLWRSFFNRWIFQRSAALNTCFDSVCFVISVATVSFTCVQSLSNSCSSRYTFELFDFSFIITLLSVNKSILWRATLEKAARISGYQRR